MTEKGPSKPKALQVLCDEILAQETSLREGGGLSGQERQRKLSRLPVRERLARLLDDKSPLPNPIVISWLQQPKPAQCPISWRYD